MSTNNNILHLRTEIGCLEILSTASALKSIRFVDEPIEFQELNTNTPQVLQNAAQQLDAYFTGEQKVFSLKLQTNGTAFQQKVWNELVNIPYGTTTTYKEIAKRIGNTMAMRAVGNANNKNELAIVIPCHRVVGANGKLTGYASGLWRKEWLLNLEKKFGVI